MGNSRRTGATIVDIARKLGVSAMTVSRALTGSTEVSEQTRQRVLRCADELGYRPHRWARTLVTRRSSIVGVVIPDIAHSYFAEVTCGIEEVVEKAGYDVLLCHSGMDAKRELAEIDMLLGSQVEGLVVASEQAENSPQVFQRLKESRVPFILVDRFFPGQGFASVHVDDTLVGRLAMAHLIEYGHQRIAHIRGPKISPAMMRYKAYLDVLKKHKIPVRKEYVVDGHFEIESGREAMSQLLKLEPRPTAVFAGNDPMAVGAVYACRDAGVSVPGDMSIIGAGNIEGVHHPNPFLTTIDWPRVELGRTAATLLIAAIANPDHPHSQAREELVTPRLLIRQSTARVRMRKAAS